MKITFDPKTNIGYIAFREKSTAVETVRVSEELAVDVAPDGTVFGVELLNANLMLGLGVNPMLEIANTDSGAAVEVQLPG